MNIICMQVLTGPGSLPQQIRDDNVAGTVQGLSVARWVHMCMSLVHELLYCLHVWCIQFVCTQI